MKSIFQKTLLLLLLGVSAAWATDDDDSHAERKKELPEEVENTGSGKSGKNKKNNSPHNIEETRDSYAETLLEFKKMLLEALDADTILETTKKIIDARLALYTLQIADVEDPQIRAAYLAALLINLQDFINQGFEALKPAKANLGIAQTARIDIRGLPNQVFHTCTANFFRSTVDQDWKKFLAQIFPGVNCQYNNQNLLEYLQNVLNKLGHTNEDDFLNLMNFIGHYNPDKSLEPAIRGLNPTMATIIERGPFFNERITDWTFWLYLIRELRTDYMNIMTEYHSNMNPLGVLMMINDCHAAIKALKALYNIIGRDEFIRMLQNPVSTRTNEATPLMMAFEWFRAQFITNIHALIGQDKFIDLLKFTNSPRSPLHVVFDYYHWIEALQIIIGQEAFIALLMQKQHPSNPIPYLQVLHQSQSGSQWLIVTCKNDKDFRNELKKALQSSEWANNSIFKALLEFLNTDPDEGCKKEEIYQSDDDSDDDDDSQGGGSTTRKGDDSKRPVINVDCSHLPETQTTGRKGGSSSSKKGNKDAAFSLQDAWELNPEALQDGSNLRSMLVEILGS